LEPIRQEWLDAIVKFQHDPERPQGEAAWSPPLDLASADELRAIQSAKLPLAVRFAYQSIPFYRRKFDRIGLEPGDVRGLDDLAKIPITTKQEMADDVAENPVTFPVDCSRPANVTRKGAVIDEMRERRLRERR